MNYNIKQLTDKFITEEDNQLFKSVIGNGIDELLKNEIDESLFFSAQKHIPSDLDEMGLHSFRSLLSEKIINNNRVNTGILDNEYGDKFIRDGIVIIDNCDINEEVNLNKYIDLLRVLEFNPTPLQNVFEGWDEKIQPMGPSFRLNVDNTYYSVKDSNKINKRLNELGFKDETPITGSDWTLIVADTSGLHRRFPASPGVERVTYRHQSPRVNPFEVKYN